MCRWLIACLICLQVRERCPSLVRECHVLLPLLEEMEKHISAFYQALERASRITSAARDPESQTQTQQKQKWQVRYDDNEHAELEYLSGRATDQHTFIFVSTISSGLVKPATKL